MKAYNHKLALAAMKMAAHRGFDPYNSWNVQAKCADRLCGFWSRY